MNKNLIGIILIVLALALVFFYGWPKMKPYLASPEPAPEGVTTEPPVPI